MLIVPLESVRIPANRHRKAFDEIKIKELAQSIQSKCLIHLPVVRRISDDGQYELVAGERRKRAIELLRSENKPFSYLHTEIPVGMFPCALFEELDVEMARQIELEENALRVDLTWQERAQAITALHESRKAANPTWTPTDTAELITGTRSNATDTVGERLLLAQNLHRPEVAKAASEKEALATLKFQLQREFETELGKRIDRRVAVHTLRHCGFMEGAKELESEFFDCIIADPPYGVGAENFHASIVVTHGYKDDKEYAQALMEFFAPESWRVAAPQSHLYLFCDVQYFLWLRGVFCRAGWDVWPRPLVWHKDVGFIPRPHHGPKRMYECILYALKGDKMVTGLYEDVIVCPAEKNKLQAAQKPVDLYVNLLKRSTMAGNRVLDPFCGSGTIFPAANQLKLVAWGFDVDPAMIAIASERMGQ